MPVNLLPAGAPPGALIAAPSGGLLPMYLPAPVAGPPLMLAPQQPVMFPHQQLAGLLQQLPAGHPLLGGLQPGYHPQAPPQQPGMVTLPPALSQLLLSQQGAAALPALLQQLQQQQQQQQYQLYQPQYSAAMPTQGGLAPQQQGASGDPALQKVLPALPDSLVQLLLHTPLPAPVASVTVQADSRGHVLLTNGASLQTPDAAPVSLVDVLSKLQALLAPSTPGANPFQASDTLALPDTRSTVTATRATDEQRSIISIRYDIVRDVPPADPGGPLPQTSSIGPPPHLGPGSMAMPTANGGLVTQWSGGPPPGAVWPAASGGLPYSQYGQAVVQQVPVQPAGAPFTHQQQAAAPTGGQQQQPASEAGPRFSSMPPHLAHVAANSTYSTGATSQLQASSAMAPSSQVPAAGHMDPHQQHHNSQQPQQPYYGAPGLSAAAGAGGPRPTLVIPNGVGEGGDGISPAGTANGNLVSPGGGLSEYSTNSLGGPQQNGHAAGPGGQYM